MVTRTYIDKSTTILEGSHDNFGLNPSITLCRGKINSRGLLHFVVDGLKNTMDRYGITKDDNTRHFLKMYNCGSLERKNYHSKQLSGEGVLNRASSFTIIAFELPTDWDEGRGFDNSTDWFLRGHGALSTQGANWFNARSDYKWPFEGIYWDYPVSAQTYTGIKGDEGGYPSFETIFGKPDDVPIVSGGTVLLSGYTDYISLSTEYMKFTDGEDSIIIAEQRFDYGNEDLSMDITNYVNSLIYGTDGIVKKNHGIAICILDNGSDTVGYKDEIQYTQFFSEKTNTFYLPFIETVCESCTIVDNRGNFNLGYDNRLYFFTNENNVPFDLDETPVCTINGNEYSVKRRRKGVYYASVNLPLGLHSENETLYDVWGNLKINGISLNDVEDEFIVHQGFSFRPNDTIGNDVYFILSGIKSDERLLNEWVRTISITMKKHYQNEILTPLLPLYYKLSIRDSYRVIDVTPWDRVDIIRDTATFRIDVSILPPQEYYISLKYGDEVFSDQLRFKVVNDATKVRR